MTDRELAASYILGELDATELAAFERRLEHDPDLRSEVEATARISAVLESLPADAWPDGAGAAAPPIEEPVAALPADTPSVATSPATAPPRAPRRRREHASTAGPPRRRLVRPAYALAAVAAALVIGVVVGDLVGGNGSGGSGGTTAVSGGPAVALKPLEGGSQAAAVVHVDKGGTVELDAHGLPDSGSGHYYELWLMTDAARTVPVASFAVGDKGTAKVRVPLPADPKSFAYYDISRQKVGGGTKHSTESVLRAPTGPQ